MSSGFYCPECGADDYRESGMSESGVQRYSCRHCSRRFTDNTASAVPFGAEVAESKKLTKHQKMVQEISSLRSQVRALTNEAIDTTQLRQLIHNLDTAKLNPPRWLTQPKTTGALGTPTLFLSDLHWGEVVRPREVNGANEYNLAVARRRLERTFSSTVRLTRDYLRGNYHGIVLALGGDLVSGNIHEELRETNEKQIFAIVLDLYENLVTGIELLADEFGRVFIPCVVGNHGRLDRKPRAKGAVRDNFEWILYQFLVKHFEDDDRVTIIVSEALDFIYRVHNTRYLLTHGDQFRGGTGISGPVTPWALGDHRKRKRQDAISQPYDVMIFGHWHQLFWGGGTYIVNGSLKGYDEYAYRSNFPFQAPAQALWITHPDKGVTFQMPVLAEEIPDRPETEWVSLPSVA